MKHADCIIDHRTHRGEKKAGHEVILINTDDFDSAVTVTVNARIIADQELI